MVSAPKSSKTKANPQKKRRQQQRAKSQAEPVQAQAEQPSTAPKTKPNQRAAQKAPEPPKPRGAPALEFSQAVADRICSLTSTSTLSLAKILDAIEGAPSMTTIFKWLSQRPDFAENLARAREARADFVVDQATDIADDSHLDVKVIDGKIVVDGECVARTRLRVETRLKVAALLSPKKYGSKLDVTSDGKAINHASDDELRQRAFEMAKRNGALAGAPA